MEAKRDIVTRQDLRHDRHTVSLLTDHLVFLPKYSVSGIARRLKGRSGKQTLLEKAFTEKRFAVSDRFPQLLKNGTSKKTENHSGMDASEFIPSVGCAS